MFEHVVDRAGGRAPARYFDVELTSPRGRNLVSARTTLMVRRYLTRFDPAGFFHPVKRGIQRSFFDTQMFREALNTGGDAVPVERPTPIENGEDEERERALERIRARRHT